MFNIVRRISKKNGASNTVPLLPPPPPPAFPTYLPDTAEKRKVLICDHLYLSKFDKCKENFLVSYGF